MSGKAHPLDQVWLMALLLSISLSTACDDSPRSGPMNLPVTVIRQPIDRSIRLDLKEVWRVGHALDPARLQLFGVGGAALSQRGSVFVLDRGNARVIELGASGEFLRQFGAEGDGPGEFRGATGIAARHDTVFVADRGNRVHFFSSEGTVLETHLLRFPAAEANSLGLIGSSDRGWVVAGNGYFDEGAPGKPPVQRSHFFRLNPSSGELEATGLRWSHESPGQYRGIFWLQPILEHRPVLDLDGRGHVILADTLTYRLDVLSIEGEHILRIENEVPLRAIDADLIDKWRASRRCPTGPESVLECSTEMDRIILGMERASHRPIVARIQAYASGFFSVLRADLDPNPFDSGTPSEYDHFSPDGSFLGSTSGVVPLTLDGVSMIGLERDSLGVETVVRYQVSARRAAL